MSKIHPLAEVHSKTIGDETIIWQFTIVLTNAKIGNWCNINAYCFIENEVIVGDNVTIKCGVYLWDGITIEDNVQIGPNVTFINDRYPRAKHKFSVLNTTIRQGASIGGNSTIMGGIEIGQYAMVGAGSVVTKNIPPHTLWFGNPAIFKGYVCNCGGKLDDNLECKSCGHNYVQSDGFVIAR
jgi:UDP-2-acetamido-3-amino-2,3-dideoxy-glucuronate N-acetyltransferase